MSNASNLSSTLFRHEPACGRRGRSGSRHRKIAAATSSERLPLARRRGLLRWASALLSCWEQGSTPSPADAAILAAAQGALSPPPDSVFHVPQPRSPWGRALLSPTLCGPPDPCIGLSSSAHEAAWNGTTMSSYRRRFQHALPWDQTALENHPPVDTAATIRSLISSGQANVAWFGRRGRGPGLRLVYCRVCRRVAGLTNGTS